MSERKKETLFRFKTLRTPELITDEAKEKYFIKHPDGTSGPFYAAIAAMTGGDTKKGVLAVAATAFTGDKTKKQIKAIDPALSKFGLFLAKKKNKLTLAEVNTEITGLSALSAPKELKLWDSLLYQTIKAESGYAREAILQLIIANYFVTKFSGMELTDTSMQKWAKSRVVISLEIAAKENDYFDTTTENDSASGKDILLHHIEAAEAKIKIDLATKAEKELTTYKTAFLKTSNKQEKNAFDAHTIAVQAAQDSATTVDEVDQFTQFTFKTFTNYTPPVFSFQKPDEIDKSTMQSSFSAETSFLMEEKDLFLTSNFDEMDEKLENHSKSLTKSIFDRSQFFTEKVDVDGTYVSTCEMKHRFNKKYKFIIKLIQKSTNGYGAILTIDVGDECLKLDTAIANFKAPISTTFTTKEGTNLNGIFTIDLLPNKSIDLSSVTSLEVSGELIFSNGLVLNFAKDLVGINSFMSGTMTVNSSSSNNSELFIPTSFGMKQLGIADYRKVEQTLCCYVPGEVAHIENVMAREYKERSTRRLRRSDEKTTSTSSLESESMTDTSTTSRFDMQKEISKIISESKERNISVGFDASVGGKKTVLGSEVDFRVGANFSADFATSSSSEESENESTSFAKDITEKATQRLVSNVSEERTTRIIEEFEENNQHGLDNRQGAEHISGVYRWVDKIYKNEIHNYGKRLQYEFMIPEPSKFHLIAKASGITSSSGIPLVKPIDPRKDKFGILNPIRNSAHILPTNYHQWAAVYGATVSPPPNASLNIGATLVRPDDGSSLHDAKVVKQDIVIPDGYGIQDIRFSVGGIKVKHWSHYFVSAAGITKKIHEGVIHSRLFTIADEIPQLRGFTRSIPISAQFSAINGGIVSFSIKLSRKHSLMEKWQLNTFKSIISAYENKLQDYKDAIAEMEARKGILMGDNPGYYRRIENTVLKKNCISYLAGHAALGQSYTTGEEIGNHQVQITEEMDKYAATVKFFEQAFDWEIMDYHFYPFYWANKDRWAKLYAIENDDHLFRAFLRSGMARTIVTVRPGFEEVVMYYLRTGLIWNGGTMPVIEDELYISIVDELANPEYTLEETWETRMPSALTVIQAKTIGLDAEGLPCYCDTGTPPEESLTTPIVNPLESLDVHIDGKTPPTV